MVSNCYRLVSAGSYIGTKKNNWVPEREPFLIGYKNNIAIYNLSLSAFFFNCAINFIAKCVSQGGRGFFFGLNSFTKPINNLNILNYYKLDQVVTFKNWRGGYVTNTKSFRNSILNGIKRFCFVSSIRFDYSNFPVISEANRIKLPLIIPIDSNSPISDFAYPIPSNSTGSGVTQMYGQAFASAVFSGIFKKCLRFKTISISSNKMRKSLNSSSNKNSKYGRRWNRTTAVSFSGLNSTIELSPLKFF